MRVTHLEHYLSLVFLVSLIWSIVAQMPGYNIYAPRQVTVQEGLCVHIPCTFTVPKDVTLSKNPNGFWYRPESPVECVASTDVSSVSENAKGRFLLIGDVSRGDCSFSINNALSGDENTYQFRLQDVVHFNYRGIIPRLTVTALREQPEISSVKSLFPGDEVTVTCTSPGRCAGFAPIITWTGVQGTSTNYQDEHADGNRTYSSKFTFTASKRDNEAPLTCTVSFQPSKVTTSKEIILNVQYPPSISITIGEIVTSESIHFIMKEGEDLSMHCVVDSNPKSVISWFMGRQEKNGKLNGNVLSYELKNIGLSDAGIYLCSAQNVYGMTNRSIEIIVQYPPRRPMIICSLTKNSSCIMEYSNITYALEGSSLSLFCSVDSFPAATLIWIKPEHHIFPALSSEQINLPNISLSEEGLYTCQANNTHGLSKAPITIKVTYKPKQVAGENSTCLQDESHIECTCKIQSFPQANVQWKIDEKLYTSSYSDKDLNISTAIVNAVMNSSLTLKVSLQLVQQIHCLASNKFGNLSLLLLSNTQSTLNIQAIAAACGVIFIAVLVIAGFLIIKYIRKKTLEPKPEDKKDFNTSDCNVIYSNTELYCNGAQAPQQLPAQEDGSVYMNCEDIHYASINFPKTKAKPVEGETEIEYAEIKRK